MKKIISLVLALSLLCMAGAAFAEGPGGGHGGNGGPGGGHGGMRGGNGGGNDKSSDTELQTMIAEVAPKFQLLSYEDAETQKADVAAMLAEGNSANFVTFTLGTTLAEGQTAGSGAGEHMTSFDYAYKLEAVRDWLFEQSK